MEHKEHYDPEDIEQLLETHNFDELIPEEKAFVLKHMKDKQEYERVRATRVLLHESIGGFDRLEPDERTKQNVLDVFRETKRQRPRIWLNSVLAMFSGPNHAMTWRPVLQIASVVLLVGAGFFAYDRLSEQPMTNDVAEVKSADEFEEENRNEVNVSDEENERNEIEKENVDRAKVGLVAIDDDELDVEERAEKDFAKTEKLTEVSGDLASTVERKDAENEFRSKDIADNAASGKFDVTTGATTNGNATLDVNKAVAAPSSAPVMIAEVEEDQADLEYAPEESIEDARFANAVEHSEQPADDGAALDSLGVGYDLFSTNEDVAVANKPQREEVKQVATESVRIASASRSRAFKEKKERDLLDKNQVNNSSNLAEHTALLGVLNAGW